MSKSTRYPNSEIGVAIGNVLQRLDSPMPDLTLAMAILELDALDAPVVFDDARREQLWGEMVELAAEMKNCCEFLQKRDEMTMPPLAEDDPEDIF